MNWQKVRTSKIMKKLVILWVVLNSKHLHLIEKNRSTEKHFYFDIFCLSSFCMPNLQKKTLCPDMSRFPIPVVKSSSNFYLATVVTDDLRREYLMNNYRIKQFTDLQNILFKNFKLFSEQCNDKEKTILVLMVDIIWTEIMSKMFIIIISNFLGEKQFD
jgi:hypothetical protein